jgi:hypothetical protein
MQHFTTDGHYSSSSYECSVLFLCRCRRCRRSRLSPLLIICTINLLLLSLRLLCVVLARPPPQQIPQTHNAVCLCCRVALSAAAALCSMAMIIVTIMMMTNVTTVLHGRIFLFCCVVGLFIYFVCELQGKNQFFLYYSFPFSALRHYNECVAFARRNRIIINNIMRDLRSHLSSAQKKG